MYLLLLSNGVDKEIRSNIIDIRHQNRRIFWLAVGWVVVLLHLAFPMHPVT